MYNDLFTVFGLTVHGYGLMIGLGVVASLMISWRRARKKGVSEDTVSTMTILAVVIGFLGGKVFYLLTHWSYFMADPLGSLGSEGFVVYGGILFGFAACWLYARRKGDRFLPWSDLLLPGVAVAQGFGRVGCFLAGCCYGAPTDSCIGVTFPAGSFAPAGVPLWPTQLISAAGDLLLALILLRMDRKKTYDGRITVWYVILYTVGRFLVEFLRADNRGSVGALSASQFIGLFVIAAALALRVFLKRGQNSEKQDKN
jgi:phosphatidylglycerol:prolipoprotein diacylglycerol transferase